MVSKGYFLVTGGSSGIGRSLVVHFSKLGYGIVAVARREEKLLETQRLGQAENIKIVTADVTTEDGRGRIFQAIDELGPAQLKYVVQNAGTIGNITTAMKMDHESWRKTFELNVDAPLMLMQGLVPRLAPEARVMHIGSGAALKPYHGWSAYCCSKAAFNMLYQCLRKELEGQNIFVGSVRPGIIETEMQEEIRRATAEDMADVERFKSLKSNEYSAEDKFEAHTPPTDGLDTPQNFCHFAEFLLTKIPAQEFSAQEWDIRDTHHHSRWIAK